MPLIVRRENPKLAHDRHVHELTPGEPDRGRGYPMAGVVLLTTLPVIVVYTYLQRWMVPDRWKRER